MLDLPTRGLFVPINNIPANNLSDLLHKQKFSSTLGRRFYSILPFSMVKKQQKKVVRRKAKKTKSKKSKKR